MTRFSVKQLALAGILAIPVMSCTKPPVKVWQTDANKSNLLTQQADVAFGRATAETVIDVDPNQRFQTMVGFGASMTDASAYLLQHAMSASQRDVLMKELFSPDGLGFSFMRLTIGASDFSRTHYTYDDMPAGESDPTLAHFSIAAAKTDVIPSVKQAISLNPNLTIMASPWSAPGWMKTTDSLLEGSLKPDAYAQYADYLIHYVWAMKAEGIDISMLSVQNEPGVVGTYPGMEFDPDSRANFIGNYLGPRLLFVGLDTKILEYDHNWEFPELPLAVLGDDNARQYIAGVAWHCYGKLDVSAQSLVHDKYPEIDTYFTECTGSGDETVPSTFAGNLGWAVKNLIIGSTRNWAKGVLEWNLALDEYGEPQKGSNCNKPESKCRGVVTVNSKTGQVTRNSEYYAYGHASKFVRPGAVRIHSTTDPYGPDNRGVWTVAFLNTDCSRPAEARIASIEPDGISPVAFRSADTVALRNKDTTAFRNKECSVVLIAQNGTEAPRTFAVRSEGKAFRYTLPAGSVATFVWRPYTTMRVSYPDRSPVGINR
jgi:glucosylceramidase